MCVTHIPRSFFACYNLPMSIFSFGKKEKKELVLIVDIGSASVGVAIASLSRTETPLIHAIVREDMVFQEELNTVRFRKSLTDALSKTVTTLSRTHMPEVLKKTGCAQPTRAYVVFSSPWHASETRTVSSVQEKPFRMTREMMDRIAKREIDSFERTGIVAEIGGDLSISEKHVMRVALNGYETSNPFGKEARTLDVGIFLSVIPRPVLDDVKQAIGRTFSIQDYSFHSFPFVVFDVVRSFAGVPDKFLIIDVSGEVTDVSLVSDRVLLETTTFPVGKRTILRALASTLSTTPDEALSLIRLTDEKRLSETHTSRIEGALSNAGGLWRSAFEKTLSGIANHASIPSTLFLSADDNLLPYFGSLVKKESFAQFTMTDEPFSIFPLSGAVLHDVCRFEASLSRDPFLMLGAAFAKKLLALS